MKGAGLQHLLFPMKNSEFLYREESLIENDRNESNVKWNET